jgi:hypothetical protein
MNAAEVVSRILRPTVERRSPAQALRRGAAMVSPERIVRPTVERRRPAQALRRQI